MAGRLVPQLAQVIVRRFADACACHRQRIGHEARAGYFVYREALVQLSQAGSPPMLGCGGRPTALCCSFLKVPRQPSLKALRQPCRTERVIARCLQLSHFYVMLSWLAVLHLCLPVAAWRHLLCVGFPKIVCCCEAEPVNTVKPSRKPPSGI